MQWTAGQLAAIQARNDSVLVSAAAGSGKTAVLVERVLSLLREGKRIDRMLIVTFTRAAAGEMRERIGRRLDEEGAGNAHLRRQAMRINRAAICTLHVFCNRLIRRHFQAAGVDPMARIGDESRLSALKKQAQDQMMEQAYAHPTADEQALFLQFEDDQICQMIDKTYDFLMSRADPFAWAEEMTRDQAADPGRWMPLLQSLCENALEGARELLPEMERILHQGDGPVRYASTYEKDAALTLHLIASAGEGTLRGGKTAFDRLSTKKAGPEESPEKAEEYKALREEWKDRIKAARGLLPEDPEKERADLAHTLPPLRALLSMVKKMHDLYQALKQQKNDLDYHDLEHFALRALSDENVRAQVAGEYDALFIDEYQDVSAIQEAIIRALHEGAGNLLFMVGDVKQSIYRFRQADPTLFLQKYQDFSLLEDAPCRKILLQQNFRSDENVLRAVNQVFSHAMREKETEIEYDEAAMLRPGGGQPFGAPVEIHLMCPGEEEEGEGELTKGYRYEAAFVARRIRELLLTAQVREGKGTRPLRYRDIALLLRYASGRAPYIAKALQAEGIPVYSDADAQYYDLPEVKDLINLLQVIVNPLQDIPLLSALRCPCFGFDEEELARIRLVERGPGMPFYQAFLSMLEKEGPLGDKARGVWRQLEDWRFLSLNVPADQLIWQVLEESGLYMRAGAMEDGELRQANLRLLAQQAQGEAAQGGLAAFLQETGRIHMGDDGKSAKTLGENEDVVRILTMHKSKGLEFPVVFLLEMARPFRKGGGEEALLRLHGKYGLALKYVEGEKRITHDTCALSALKGAMEREARAEEARLLYVGMTRAREKLILVGSPKKLSAALEKWARPATAYAAGSASCMLDWVMESLGGLRKGETMAENGSIWQMQLQHAPDLARQQGGLSCLPELMEDTPPAEYMEMRLSRQNAPQPPLKTSVTAIAKALRKEGDDWESPNDKRISRQEETPLPHFLTEEGEISALHRGVITHRVLGLVPYDWMRRGQWMRGLNALSEKGLLTPAEREAVRIRWLKGFFQSDVGMRALAAGEVHREWAFNFRGEGKGLIQGVIDLCFMEEDQWILVDYKTDFAPAEELIGRYGEQIRWYARALSEITGKPVKEALLFSLREGRAVSVSLP
ncbi:MAG: UvrD-helicase domain-containing protein [Clostridia bacterium]|nr:UvrD-helicase domain-containing protein [Clostridia bacterium]